MYRSLRRFTSNLVIFMAVPLAACASPVEQVPAAGVAQNQADESASVSSLLDRVVEAFNSRDADALASLVSDDFVYFTITDEGATIESRGREEFRAGMKSYFSDFDSVTTKFEATLEAGPYVAIRETVRWSVGDRKQAQASLAVYEIREDQIVRAWYYPPYRMMMAMP